MKSLLGNSCAKGCLIYMLALVGIIVLTTMGLGGLKGKFSANVQSERPMSVSAASGEPVQATPLPTAPAANTVQDTSPAENNPVTLIPTPTQPPAAQQPGPQPKGEVQAQGQAGITGQASSPFYIVQPDDTLWSIALQYGIDVDALRSANGLSDNLIRPDQLLYLPQNGQIQQPQVQPQPQPQSQSVPSSNPAQAPAQPAVPNTQPTAIIPLMPETGVNTKP